MLLSLPPELIQLILRCSEPPTFLQLAFSCRILLELASSSRDLVLHQLCETPGRINDLDDLSTKKLFRLLLQRSHHELFGVEFQLERKLFGFPGQIVDSRASSLTDTGPREQLLLVFKDDPTVYLLDVHDGTFALRRRFESPVKQFGNVQILHTAFDHHGVYVLHRFQPFITQELDTNHPFVKQALHSNPNGNIFLAYYDLTSEHMAIRLYGFPDQSNYEPLSLAAHEEKFAISWQHVQHAHDHQVVLYTVDPDDEEPSDEESEGSALDSPKNDTCDKMKTDAQTLRVIGSFSLSALYDQHQGRLY